MEQSLLALLNETNRAVIQYRGLYSRWSADRGISYHHQLVLYAIREQGFCTQKQLCDSYLLPKQTINHVFTDLRQRGLLVCDPARSSGREKAFVLSPEGEAWAQPLFQALEDMECSALARFGPDRLEDMTRSLREYSRALRQAMEEENER